MKSVVLGHDVAAIQAIERIRQNDPDAEIVMIFFEKDGPYYQDRLIDLLAQRVSRQAVVYKSEDHLKNLRVERLDNCKVERVSVARKTVTLSDKQKIEFDKLIIAGCEKYRTPDIKGAHREGIYHLKTLDNCDAFIKQIPLLDTVFVVSDTLYGINIAAALGQRGKEVVLCSSKDYFLQGEISQSVAQDLAAFLESLGVRLMTGCQVTEILGEQALKAIRLSCGKVMATDALVMPEVDLDLRIYENLAMTQGHIAVDAGMRTSAENVFAVGQVMVSVYDYGMARQIDTERLAQNLYEGMAGQQPQEAVSDQPGEFEVAGRQFMFGCCEENTVSAEVAEERQEAVCEDVQGDLEEENAGLNSVSESQGAL